MAKEISCRQAGIDCEFLIRSEDTPELLGFVQEHCSEQHDVDASENDLREQMVEV
jgi:predicted small metal-binding protein